MITHKVSKYREIEIRTDRVVFYSLNAEGRRIKSDGYKRTEDSWLAEYFFCRQCGGELSEEKAAYALDSFQKAVCSTGCFNEEQRTRYGCCSKAKRVHCVCMISFTCPDHGQTHIGTHD